MPEDRVTCRVPTPDKEPTRIRRDAFELVRQAILDVLSAGEEQGAMSELYDRVKAKLEGRKAELEAAGIGSVGWYYTTVRLEMEVAGELVRVKDKPVTLRLGEAT
ncbi:MAG: hypothetical protein AAF561_13185 [Planctomycetota bacterium]